MCAKCQQKSYLNVIDTCGEYQLLRMFLMIVEMRKGGFRASPAFLEIGQYWIAPNGKDRSCGKTAYNGLEYLDSFAFGSPMEIRKDNDTFRHLSDQYLYPDYKVIPELKRNGFNGNLCDIHPVNLFFDVAFRPQAETLIKEGNIEMLKYMAYHIAEVKSTFGHRTSSPGVTDMKSPISQRGMTICVCWSASDVIPTLETDCPRQSL